MPKQIQKISHDYIRGLVDGEGCFTFCTTKYITASGKTVIKKIPTFSIAMNERDLPLILAVRDGLGLKNKIYTNKNNHHRDGYKRGKLSMLIVREFGNLKNVVVPFFYKKLHGYKGTQFSDWLEAIGNDPDVPESFKFIYKIYKAGFYDKNPKFE
ncbi:MAG: hypothetical protein LiPW15_785 [Parcubacteria group bacterium LiPW_15]|nr:MAG: hypothetical protein LiPW15_785 [Parcubacteria group bacterium LiPW_15]